MNCISLISLLLLSDKWEHKWIGDIEMAVHGEYFFFAKCSCAVVRATNDMDKIIYVPNFLIAIPINLMADRVVRRLRKKSDKSRKLSLSKNEM